MDPLKKLKTAYDPEDFRRSGHELVDMLADYLAKTLGGSGPVLPSRQPDELVEKYSRILGEADGDFHGMIREVMADSNHIHHPGYMGHQVCPPVPIAALSSLAGTLLNNGSAVYEMGMANVAMERIVVRMVARYLGFPGTADGVLTSGGSLGNLTAVLAARQDRAGHDIWKEGTGSGPLPVFLVSAQSHYSIDRGMRIMGLGEAGSELVPTDDAFRIQTEKIPGIIRAVHASGRKVIGIVANAGSTATGTYDNLKEIAEVCREHQLWLHIDGAHGAPAIFSEKYKELARGIEFADSVVIDFHKMAMTPGLNTAVVFRNGDHSYETFAQKASYLFSGEQDREWYEFARRTMECTKSMMGLNVFSILKKHGAELFDANVTRLYDLARVFYDVLGEFDEMERLHVPESNILVFRYAGRGLDQESLDRLNRAIRKAVLRNGNYYIVQANLNGSWYLRVTIMNPFSTGEDFRNLIKEIIRYAETFGKH